MRVGEHTDMRASLGFSLSRTIIKKSGIRFWANQKYDTWRRGLRPLKTLVDVTLRFTQRRSERARTLKIEYRVWDLVSTKKGQGQMNTFPLLRRDLPQGRILKNQNIRKTQDVTLFMVKTCYCLSVG